MDQQKHLNLQSKVSLKYNANSTRLNHSLVSLLLVSHFLLVQSTKKNGFSVYMIAYKI